MKFLIVALAVVACASAFPDVSHLHQHNDADQTAQVLRQTEEVGAESFNYAFETSNGISAQAEGSLQSAGSEYANLPHRGSFRYTAPDGQVIEVTYTADENGFQPQGSHLPTPPPVPEAILRSIEYTARVAPVATANAAATFVRPTRF